MGDGCVHKCFGYLEVTRKQVMRKMGSFNYSVHQAIEGGRVQQGVDTLKATHLSLTDNNEGS